MPTNSNDHRDFTPPNIVPSEYAGRRQLSAGARRRTRGASDAWADLSPTMQAKLIECFTPGGARRSYLPEPTQHALFERGICDRGGNELEPLGQLVRQAGTRTTC